MVKSDGPRPHWTFFLLSFSFYVFCFVPRTESSSSWSEIIEKSSKTKQKKYWALVESAEKLHINFSNVQHPPLLLSTSPSSIKLINLFMIIIICVVLLGPRVLKTFLFWIIITRRVCMDGTEERESSHSENNWTVINGTSWLSLWATMKTTKIN